MKKGGYSRFFSRGKNIGWRKPRQRKWKKDKEKGRWTKKVGSGKKHKGEHKREDTKRRTQTKKVTTTKKVSVFYIGT
jgi:hypothetical protein